MPKPSLWRKIKAIVLNLPDDEVPGVKERLTGKTPPAARSSSNGWDSVLSNASNPTAQTNRESSPTSELWQPVRKPQGKSSLWKTIVRWAVLFLIVLFLWIGLRTALWGNNEEEKQQPLPISVQYPSERASAVATKFTTNYLSFEEGKEDQRAAALAPYYSGGEASGKLGWDGKGKQSASNIVVYSVEPIDKEKSRVTVLADVANDTSSRTVALEMTVSVNDQGAAVYGTPAYVGLPTPAKVAAADTQNIDSQLTADTKAGADEFFAAYAANDTLDSVTAPGAHITGLNGAVSNAKLTKWSVEAGGDTERTAWADVTYESNGSTLSNSYQLTLVKVSGGESAKWQIKEIKGS